MVSREGNPKNVPRVCVHSRGKPSAIGWKGQLKLPMETWGAVADFRLRRRGNKDIKTCMIKLTNQHHQNGHSLRFLGIFPTETSENARLVSQARLIWEQGLLSPQKPSSRPLETPTCTWTVSIRNCSEAMFAVLKLNYHKRSRKSWPSSGVFVAAHTGKNFDTLLVASSL